MQRKKKVQRIHQTRFTQLSNKNKNSCICNTLLLSVTVASFFWKESENPLQKNPERMYLAGLARTRDPARYIIPPCPRDHARLQHPHGDAVRSRGHARPARYILSGFFWRGFYLSFSKKGGHCNWEQQPVVNAWLFIFLWNLTVWISSGGGIVLFLALCCLF